LAARRFAPGIGKALLVRDVPTSGRRCPERSGPERSLGEPELKRRVRGTVNLLEVTPVGGVLGNVWGLAVSMGSRSAPRAAITAWPSLTGALKNCLWSSLIVCC